MEKKSRNFKKWERFLKKDKDLSPDIDIDICAQLLANQEKFEKTILDIAKENFNKRRKMLDALQAKEIAKTNFSALEKDLELNNEYFRSISNLVGNTASQSQTSVMIPYREDPRFNDIMTVLKWKGYKIKHYRCMNWCTLYYQDPEYQELQYEPCAGGIENTGLTMGGYFSLEW